MERAICAHPLDWIKDSKGWEEGGERDQRGQASREDHPPSADTGE